MCCSVLMLKGAHLGGVTGGVYAPRLLWKSVSVFGFNLPLKVPKNAPKIGVWYINIKYLARPKAHGVFVSDSFQPQSFE